MVQRKQQMLRRRLLIAVGVPLLSGVFFVETAVAGKRVPCRNNAVCSPTAQGGGGRGRRLPPSAQAPANAGTTQPTPRN